MMASASRPTARMSSTDVLFAMRSSGSRRASAALTGSSEGNGLSVTAIKGLVIWLLLRSIFPSPALSHPSPARGGSARSAGVGFGVSGQDNPTRLACARHPPLAGTLQGRDRCGALLLLHRLANV